MKRSLLLISFLLLSSTSLWAGYEETYAEWVQYFGLDPNAGRNSFLVLLIPSGGKYESMGTAYTAMAEDLGFIDANPAVSSYLDYSEIMVMHNDWISDSNLESFAYTQRFGDLGVGIAGKIIWIPFESTNAWGETVEQGAYTESLLTLNLAYNLFQNYYYDGFSLGMNIKSGYRGISESLVKNQNALAAMADFGFISRFNLFKFYASRDRNFSLGLSIKNLGQEFIENPDPLPTSITGGLSYAPFRFITFAFDVNQPFNLNGENAEMLNYALGMDFHASSFLSIQGGFLLKTGKPRMTMGSSLTIKKMTLYTNYTLDLTTQFKPVDRMSVSVKLNLGEQGRIRVRDKVQELYLEGLESYANGQYMEAIDYWSECLELDEGFLPALEMIETTQKSLNLEQEMRDLQTVE